MKDAETTARLETIIELWTQGLNCVLYPTWLYIIVTWSPEILIMGQA